MNPHHIEAISAVIDRLDPPKRSRKLSNQKVVESVCLLLHKGIAWRDLRLFGVSYSAVYKRYHSWVRRGVFKAAWSTLLQEYSATRLAADAHWFKELFIDSTMIKNVYGVDGLGKNPTDRGRMATKLSVICDQDQIPVSACFFPANVTDVTTTIQSVNEVECNVRKDGRYSNVLIGDKGYISTAVKEALRQRRICLLTPAKKNAKHKKRSTLERARLKRRHCIENLFCRLDKFKRLHLRQDRCVCCFEAMHQLAFCMLILRKTCLSKRD